MVVWLSAFWELTDELDPFLKELHNLYDGTSASVKTTLSLASVCAVLILDVCGGGRDEERV